MSVERLNMLMKYLHQKGWKILNEDNDKTTHQLFEVIDEKLVWQLKHVDPKVSEVELHFFIFGELGRYSEDLNDIAFCETKDGKKMLNFSKINGSRWKTEYVVFVDSLITE